MPLVAATNIRLAFGTRTILDAATLAVEAGERIGIVGRNGTGKSTLIKIMAGMVKPDAGEVSVSKSARIGFLHQDPDLDVNETLRGAAEGAFADLHRLHKQLNAVYDEMAGEAANDPDMLEKLLKRQASLEERIEAAGGYAIDHKIDATLHGLGFDDPQFDVPVSGLSGGQKARLALAKLLLEQPDVLLLDEPTNHLDLDGRLWLESFLKDEFDGAVVLISHDRYLIDNVVTRIVEVEQGRLIDYPTPRGHAYLTFRKLREQRKTVQMRAWEAQQTKFKQEEKFIQKYKAGQRAKQARGRESRLNREKASTTIEKPMEMGAFRFNLPKAERPGDIIAKTTGLSKSYRNDDGSDKVLFRGLDVTISRGERWGVIGPNGAGKSTLVKCLLGELSPDAGTVKLGANVTVGYFSQSSADMDPDMQVYRYLQNAIMKENEDMQFSEQQARDLAGAFLFSGDEQEAELGRMSGGERGRARLAALLASAKNVLVLDEPTNHLDIPSAERLEDALALAVQASSTDPGRPGGEWDGTLILISHDRAIIDACCDHLIVLDGEGGAEIVQGNYTIWHERQQARERADADADAERKRRQEREDKKRRQHEHRERERQQRQSQRRDGKRPAVELLSDDKLESRITDIEERIKAIDASLGDPDVWSSPKKCDELGKERVRLTEELEPLEFEWLRRAEEANA
jgi:ATP-binding cassette subfamily F protein 3